MVKRKRNTDSTESNTENTSENSATSSAKSILNNSEDGAFPRGGGSVLSALEIKQATNEATKDVLFGNDNKGDDKSKKKKNRKNSSKPKSKEDLPKKVKIEGLSFSRLIPGTVVLGQVSQVNSLDIALSLPNNLTGFVPITKISSQFSALLEKANNDEDDKSDSEEEEEEDEKDIPELSKLFYIGQWLRAVVEPGSDKLKKRIELSIEPEKVNEKIDSDDYVPGMALQASVKSVEDHGVIMDINSDDKTGFISKKELQFTNLKMEDLVVGQVGFFTVISKSTNGKTLTLTASPLSTKVPIISSLNASQSLIAGILVEAEVKEVRSSGILTSVLEFANGTIDGLHSGAVDGTELANKFKEGDKIKARVTSTVSVDEERDRVTLSVLPHILGLNQAKPDALTTYPIGKIIDVKVKQVEPVMGLFVDMGDKAHSTGFVHISRISENRIDNLSPTDGDYALKTVHKARVLNFANADGLYVMSMEKNIIEQPYLRVEDIPVGEIVTGTVESILSKGGILIKLAEGITGLVNEFNVSDLKLAHPEKKFKVNKQVKARVLNVDKAKKKVYLTLKNSLVNTQDPILKSYSEAQVGMKTPAFILAFKPRGAIVQFFGGVKGFLPVSEMSEAFIKDPKEQFTLGQSVSVKISSVDVEEERILSSCRVASSEDMEKALESLNPGKSIVSASVVEKTKTHVVVDIGTDSVRGVIPIGQLSDDKLITCRSHFKKIKVGEELDNLLVLNKEKATNKFVTLTAKKSMVDSAKAGNMPSELSDIQPDAQLHGYVKNATVKGVFVAFANNLTGLALKQHLSDEEFISDPAEKFEEYQSISCTVLSVDRAQGRFQLTLRKAKKASDQSAKGQEAINSVDESIKKLNEFVPGLTTKAKINSIKDTQVNIQLAENQQGRIDVSQMYDQWEDIVDPKTPLKGNFQKGQVIPVKIIGYHDARNHKFLPISHRNSTHITIECSAKKSDLNTNTPYAGINYDDLKIDTTWIGYVNNHTPDFIWVNLSPSVRGRISMLDLSDDVDSIANVEEAFPIGSAIKCTVIECSNNVLRLSSREAIGTAINEITDVKTGSIIPALVTKTTATSVVVRLNSLDKIFATAYLTDIADVYKDEGSSMAEEYVPRELVKCKVIKVDTSNQKIHVSLRDSECDEEDAQVVDKAIYSAEGVKAGDVVRGFVKNVAQTGLFVALGRDVSARVQIKNLSDAFLSDWKKFFTVNELVKGKVLSVDDNGRIELTLKESVINGKKPEDISSRGLRDLEEGEIVDGIVKRIEEFGVFVRLEGTNNVSGLCHRTQVADVPLSDLSKVFSEGDKVKVKILSVDLEKKRLSLGMKASYFGDDSDVEMESEDEDDEEENEDGTMLDIGNGVEEESSEEEEEEEDDDDEQNVDTLQDGEGLSANFDWTTSILDQTQKSQESDDDDSDEENEEGEAPRKRRKRTKTTVEDKTGSLNTKLPQSVSDYERLLVGSPNSSVLWMNFMAFQLQLSEVDKAREIGNRALKTINFREEEEKFNIWVALLNLENSFGTDESLEEVFKRALQYSDPKTVHLKLLNIYIQSNKLDQAEKLWYTTAKKFGAEDLNIYVNFARFLFEQKNKPEEARDILNRALQALPKNQHREVILKFAQVEFEKGQAERGRTLIEGLISSYPKRVDLWNVFIDQEIKHVKDRNKIEEIFERLFNSSMKLTMKRAKFFFKKWLTYEEKYGDNKKSEYVKAKAADYVKNHGNNNT